MLPTIGSKELVAWLPALLGLGPGDAVVIPRSGLPDVRGRRAAGRRRRSCAPTRSTARRPARRSGWSGSTRRPTRPAGCCRPSTCARSSPGPASAARVVARDECYLELGWEAEPVSVLHPDVCGGDARRACWPCTRCPSGPTWPATAPAFVAGDPALVAELLEVRKHAGMMVPGAGAGRDGRRAGRRRRTWPSSATGTRARRDLLRAALEAAGFRIEPLRGRRSTCGRPAASTAGTTVDWLAERGILVAPGGFYGPRGAQHVRVALTATDERAAMVQPASPPDPGRSRDPTLVSRDPTVVSRDPTPHAVESRARVPGGYRRPCRDVVEVPQRGIRTVRGRPASLRRTSSRSRSGRRR